MALLSAKGTRSKLIGGGGVDPWEQLVPQGGLVTAQLEQAADSLWIQLVPQAGKWSQLPSGREADNLWI